MLSHLYRGALPHTPRFAQPAEAGSSYNGARTSWPLAHNVRDSLRDFVRMVNQQLPVIHLGKDFYMCFGKDSIQMFGLRLRDKGLQRTVLIVDIVTMDRLEFVCINGLVPVKDCTPAAIRIDFPALIQQYIKVV